MLRCPDVVRNGTTLLNMIDSLKELRLIDEQVKHTEQWFPVYWPGNATKYAQASVELFGTVATLGLLVALLLASVCAQWLYKTGRVSVSVAQLVSRLDYRDVEVRSCFVGGLVAVGVLVGVLIVFVFGWSFRYAAQTESVGTRSLEESGLTENILLSLQLKFANGELIPMKNVVDKW